MKSISTTDARPAEDPQKTGTFGGKKVFAAPPVVTWGEVVVIGAALLLFLIAFSGFATAYLGKFSALSVVLTVLVLVTTVVVVVSKFFPLIRWPSFDRSEAALLVVIAALALWMFLPGFSYAVGDRDPGIYMMHGAHIARTGSIDAISPELAAGLPVGQPGPRALQIGLWIEDQGTGLIRPQFYHLWSGLLAIAYLAHGFSGETYVTPLVAVLAVLLCTLVARRVGGLAVAAISGVLLSTNMMQVWQAKYPSTEIFAQTFFLGALLSVFVAVQTRSKTFAVLGGGFVGASYLARPDGFLLVALAVGVLVLIRVFRRWDEIATSFAIGMFLSCVVGAFNAYVIADDYTNDNLPSGYVLGAGLIGMVAVGALASAFGAGWIPRMADWLQRRRSRRLVATTVTALAVVGFVLAIFRPLFGQYEVNYNGRIIRDYREESLYWLSWFFTWPGLVAMLFGVCVLVWRKWTTTTTIFLLPLLTLLPLYLWNPRNSPYLMWWSRRFIPTVMPGVVIAIAVGVVILWSTRKVWWAWLGRAASVALAGFLVVVFIGQSAPLRDFDEWAGSYNVVESLATAAPTPDAVFLWDSNGPCCAQAELLFSGPLWFYFDMTSLRLTGKPDTWAPLIDAISAEYGPDRPILLVTPGETMPPEMIAQLDGYEFTRISHLSGALPHWADSTTGRPDKAIYLPFDISVYRIEPAKS